MYLGTPAIVDLLLAANASCALINDFGSTKLMSAYDNPAATPEMLASLCRDGTIDVCHRRRPKSFFLIFIFRLFEMAVWLRLLTSDFATGLAHMRGGTALHIAARFGHTSLARWLLDNGARKSLHVKNAMGCTPLDVAHAFGPFPETEAVLIQAVLSDEFDALYVIRYGARLPSRKRMAAAVRTLPRPFSRVVSSSSV